MLLTVFVIGSFVSSQQLELHVECTLCVTLHSGTMQQSISQHGQGAFYASWCFCEPGGIVCRLAVQTRPDRPAATCKFGHGLNHGPHENLDN